MAAKAQPDLSEFETLGRRLQHCKLARHAERLEPDERANLAAALAAEHIGHASVSKWLERRGLRVSDHVVREHRLGLCCCVRT